MTTKQILKKAKSLMNNGGTHWAKRSLSRKRGEEMSYCMVGGILAACDVKRGSYGWSNSPSRIPKKAHPALLSLASTIQGRPVKDVLYAVWTIEGKNDSPDTNWEHVTQWLDESIRGSCER